MESYFGEDLSDSELTEAAFLAHAELLEESAHKMRQLAGAAREYDLIISQVTRSSVQVEVDDVPGDNMVGKGLLDRWSDSESLDPYWGSEADYLSYEGTILSLAEPVSSYVLPGFWEYVDEEAYIYSDED